MDKLLLDTAYLLPIFGLRLKLEGFADLFPKLLGRYHVIYNPISLVEAKLVMLRLGGKKPEKLEIYLQAYRKGLEALRNEEKIHPTPLTTPKVEEVADRLLKAGIRSYFDRLIYATAAVEGAIFLTEDADLSKVNPEEDAKPKAVKTWAEIRQELE